MAFGRRGFRKRSFGPSLPKPVGVGEEYDVEINEMGSRGDGIARVKNFVVFVPSVTQGEKTRIKIKEVRNRFAIGEKVRAVGAVEEPKEEIKEEMIEETEEEPTEEIEAEEEVEEETEEI